MRTSHELCVIRCVYLSVIIYTFTSALITIPSPSSSGLRQKVGGQDHRPFLLYVHKPAGWEVEADMEALRHQSVFWLPEADHQIDCFPHHKRLFHCFIDFEMYNTKMNIQEEKKKWKLQTFQRGSWEVCTSRYFLDILLGLCWRSSSQNKPIISETVLSVESEEAQCKQKMAPGQNSVEHLN